MQTARLKMRDVQGIQLRSSAPADICGGG